ncbi:PfkB family carbohydrate kinase [Sinomonas susongensis]|uniref:PfkB family carbohydrate kinase n=1 Tax=Sinomonas susongensis TaxID=1324851 RepID=UPI0011082FF9|nr:PfkB family carbohydrate kinase [Sinomonas susongensis]
MKIAVVGDTLLDIDLVGHADRLCPDAPVPVLDVDDRLERAGGAGLVATLLADDGHEVDSVTALGEDDAASRLRALLGPVRIHAAPLGAPTPVKMRLTASGQRIARVDEGCATPPYPVVDAGLLSVLEEADAVVVADYGRRFTSVPTVRAALETVARRVPVVWDPHPRGARPISGAAAVTPNLSELLTFSGREVDEPGAVAVAAGRMRQRWGARAVVVTLGERGALVCTPDGDTHVAVPSAGLRIEDPCGAGDRFASSLTIALAHGEPLGAATEAAVATAAAFLAAGGVASLRRGAQPGFPEAEGTGASADSPAVALARRVRAAGGTVVAAGGCFDLLHAGHLHLLQAARALGDCLIVCLNSDDSIRRLKGPGRPVMNEHDRAELLLALSCVDAVEIFTEDTPEAVLETLRPHVWVKGADYNPDELPESKQLRSWGGEVVTVPLAPGRSTTGLAAAIASLG